MTKLRLRMEKVSSETLLRNIRKILDIDMQQLKTALRGTKAGDRSHHPLRKEDVARIMTKLKKKNLFLLSETKLKKLETVLNKEAHHEEKIGKRLKKEQHLKADLKEHASEQIGEIIKEKNIRKGEHIFDSKKSVPFVKTFSQKEKHTIDQIPSQQNNQKLKIHTKPLLPSTHPPQIQPREKNSSEEAEDLPID